MFDSSLNKLKVLFGQNRAERSMTVHPDDLFIVSYPRSGNTWMRFLLGNLIFRDEEITFANLEDKVPDIHQHADRYLRKIARPRILKSHEYFDPRYRKVIYLVRDPRDVCVSYYYYHVKFHKIDEDYSMDRFVERFISGDLDPFGSWGEHVDGWLGAREGSDHFLLIRYEDLMAEANKAVNIAASFLNLQVDQTRLESVVQRSSFETMQRLEKQQSHRWKILNKSRKDILFIRAAQVNGWEGELSTAAKEMIEATWPELMGRLGYQR